MSESGDPIRRRKSVGVEVGGVRIGGGAPVVVQSMTNTDTADAESTAAQVKALADAGSELVRLTVNTHEGYVQPRGVDLSKVLIKAQDGLFIEAAVSMTARRTLGLASTRMSWPRVRNLVEKPIEQELIHQALQFNALEDLERNLKAISESFCELPIVHELSRDFGVEVLRFNIEIRYPPETVDALKRKADASAGGSAYLAYAAAAHLDPDAPESRHLYQIFQETSSQVDAARNLGGGISSLVSRLGRSPERREPPEEEETNE